MKPTPPTVYPTPFVSVVRAVRKRKALVAAVALVATGAAGAFALRAPKQYRATATLLLDRPLPTDLGVPVGRTGWGDSVGSETTSKCTPGRLV